MVCCSLSLFYILIVFKKTFFKVNLNFSFKDIKATSYTNQLKFNLLLHINTSIDNVMNYLMSMRELSLHNILRDD